MSTAALIATRLNVPYGDIVCEQDVVDTLKNGDFLASTASAKQLLETLFIEVAPHIILKCAEQLNTPLEKLNKLYTKSVETYMPSMKWENSMSALA